MKKKRSDIRVAEIELNTGQLEWLPANPRTWTKEDLEATAASIREDEDFLEDRPLLVVPFGKKHITFAGNIRHEGCVEIGKETVPCVIYYPETEADYEVILRRAMKDNGTYGQTDWHAVFSSKWGTLPLKQWGLTPPSWDEQQEGGAGSPDEYGTEFSLPDGDKAASNQITFYFAPEQKSFIQDMLDEVEEGEDNFGNNNKAGNKLYQIVKQWAESRT